MNKAAQKLGRIKTPAKAMASRRNGKLGGRPSNKALWALVEAFEFDEINLFSGQFIARKIEAALKGKK